MTSTVQFIPTAAEDYDDASTADLNRHVVDYDFGSGLGYSSTVVFVGFTVIPLDKVSESAFFKTLHLLFSVSFHPIIGVIFNRPTSK